MKLVANMINLTVAGGRGVGHNFLRALNERDESPEVHAFVPPGCGYEAFGSSRVELHFVPAKLANLAGLPLLHFAWLPRRVRELAPDVVFSMGNIAIPGVGRQVLLFHWPYAIYPESPAWQLMSRRERWVRKLRLAAFERGLRHATRVIVQTPTARARIERLYGLENVCEVPPAISLEVAAKAAGRDWSEQLGPTRRKLLCISRYYSHKNIEALVDVGHLIRRSGEDCKILLTIEASESRAAEEVLRRIEADGLSDVVTNLGSVPVADVSSLFMSVDGLILPTWLESFSVTYVEAMQHGVPVFTSDLDFARDVCGDLAYYFDPGDPRHIWETVRKAFDDPKELERRIEAGRRHAEAMPDWHVVAGMYLDVLESVARS